MSTQRETESEHFSPYRADGKLVSLNNTTAHLSTSLLTNTASQYGFVCIVTGATHPIGRAVVHELAAHGAAVVYACSSEPTNDFNGLIDEVKAASPGTKVIGYPFKLADEQMTLALIDDVLNAWGR
jgi:NADP-dependent 3-hydroxy acid dehydrogenase YdfG